MNHRLVMGAFGALALLVGGALADGLQSGPPVGKHLAAFEPLHVTGPDEGTKRCLV